MPKNTGPLYLLLILPSVLLTVCDIIDRIKNKDSHCVRWLLLLEVILSGSSFPRLHLDNGYLDVYIGDERIRYMSTFLSGAEDFKAFVREQKSEKRSKKP